MCMAGMMGGSPSKVATAPDVIPNPNPEVAGGTRTPSAGQPRRIQQARIDAASASQSAPLLKGNGATLLQAN